MEVSVSWTSLLGWKNAPPCITEFRRNQMLRASEATNAISSLLQHWSSSSQTAQKSFPPHCDFWSFRSQAPQMSLADGQCHRTCLTVSVSWLQNMQTALLITLLYCKLSPVGKILQARHKKEKKKKKLLQCWILEGSKLPSMETLCRRIRPFPCGQWFPVILNVIRTVDCKGPQCRGPPN